jgi:hypothetical protein
MVLVMTVVLVIGAVTIDAGLAISEKTRLQTAADSAALAAAYEIGLGGDGEAAACNKFTANGFPSSVCQSDCTEPEGQDVCINNPPLWGGGAHVGEPGFIEVIASASSPAPFLRVLNEAGIFEPSARAVASFTPGDALESPCGFCVLGNTGTALTVAGNGTLTVNTDVSVNANVAVNGTNSILSASAISASGSASGTGTYSPPPTTGALPITDPLLGAPLPPPLPVSATPNPTGGTINPGIYSSFNVTSGTLTLNPGVYALVGSGISLTATGRIVARDAMIYFSCSTYPASGCLPGQAGAGIQIAGNSATLTLDAPDTGPYAGMALFFDRNNTAALRTQGNGTLDVVGSIYAREGTLSLAGNGAAPDLHSLVVVKRATISGNGAGVVYNPEENFPPVGTEGGLTTVNLVE